MTAKIKKIAAIDIGTNSVLYSIFEISGKSLLESTFKRYSPRIGSKLKGHRKPRISRESYDRLHTILSRLIRHAEKHDADELIIAATNPLRLAQNGRQIKNRLEKSLGIKIAILSTRKEAYLSFIGAVGNLRKNQTAAMIDLGGGSSEIVVYRGQKLQAFVSIPEGAVSLTERFGLQRQINAEAFAEIENYLSIYDKKLKKTGSYIRKKVVLVGGTSSALAYMRKGDAFLMGKTMAYSSISLKRDVLKLSRMSLVERRRKLQTDKKRAEIIFGGAFLLSHLFNKLGISTAVVSARGLRHGLAATC